jgi:hypothetical protein
VRPGDALLLAPARSKPGARAASRRILRWRWQLFNQDRIEVLDLEPTSLFDLA